MSWMSWAWPLFCQTKKAIHQVVVGDVAGEAPHAVRVVPDLLGPVEAGRVGGALHPDGHRMLGPVPLPCIIWNPLRRNLPPPSSGSRTNAATAQR